MFQSGRSLETNTTKGELNSPVVYDIVTFHILHFICYLAFCRGGQRIVAHFVMAFKQIWIRRKGFIHRHFILPSKWNPNSQQFSSVPTKVACKREWFV